MIQYLYTVLKIIFISFIETALIASLLMYLFSVSRAECVGNGPLEDEGGADSYGLREREEGGYGERESGERLEVHVPGESSGEHEGEAEHEAEERLRDAVANDVQVWAKRR